jgi:hypothetical protein
VSEIRDLRLDIDALNVMIDASLARGVMPDDIVLRACTDVLADRRASLARLLDRPGPLADEADVG